MIRPAGHRGALVLASLGAFGLGSVVALNGIVAGWVIAGFFAGAVNRHQRVASALGLVAAAITWANLNDSLAPLPAWEGPDYGLIFGAPVVAVLTGLAIWLGARLVRPADAAAAPAGRAGNYLPARLLGITGLVGVAAAATAMVIQVSVPSRGSFTLDLPSGWSELDRTGNRYYYDPTYGAHFTAVLGPPDSLYGPGLPAVPVIGVTVIRAPYSPLECVRSVHGWSPSDGALYQWKTVSDGDVVMAEGPSHRVVKVQPDGSGLLYGWGFTRSRQVGVLEEDLCYILVITTPTDSLLTSAQADALAAAFRFR